MQDTLKTAWRRAQKQYSAPFDPTFVEVSTRVLRQIARHGLDYAKIGLRLGTSAASIDALVQAIEMASPNLLNTALRSRKKIIRKTGRRFVKDSDGVYPLEYYLLNCDVSPPSSPFG